MGNTTARQKSQEIEHKVSQQQSRTQCAVAKSSPRHSDEVIEDNGYKHQWIKFVQRS